MGGHACTVIIDPIWREGINIIIPDQAVSFSQLLDHLYDPWMIISDELPSVQSLMVPSVVDEFDSQSSMGGKTVRTIQRHGLGARNGEEFSSEGGGWVEQLPSKQRQGVKISISVGGATQEILAWIRANPNSVNVTARALVCVMP